MCAENPMARISTAGLGSVKDCCSSSESTLVRTSPIVSLSPSCAHRGVRSFCDDTYAFGKACMRSTPSLRRFPNVAFETVPVLV